MAGQGEKLAADERALLFALEPAERVGHASLAQHRRTEPATPPPAQERWQPRLRQVSNAASGLAASIEVEAARGAGFLLIPVLFCAGAVLYFALPWEPAGTALAAGVGISALAACLARGRATFWPAIALLVVVSGMAAGKVETWRASTKVIGGEITTRLTGRVVAIEHRPNGRVRLTLDLLATERPTLRYQPDRVRVTARDVPADTRAGSVVTGVARLLPPLGPLRPGSYDFAFESYFDGIGANGFFYRNPILVETPAPASLQDRFSALVENARLQLAGRIEGHIGGAEGEIAAALVTGVRAGIPEDANETLRVTGLAHVLSISGLHMALVAGVFLGLLRAIFALFPDFSSRRPVRKYAAVAAIGGLSLYLFISGAEVAAVRSYLMIVVMLVALLFDRAALTMRNLAIAALAILAVSPHEAAGPSFQMSFAATAALIAAYGWWSERRASNAGQAPVRAGMVRRVSGKLLFYAVGLMATSLIAGTATGIFGAWHFQRISPLGLVANLATMPIVSVLVMPFAVLGTALMPFDLDRPAFIVMGAGLRWMLDIAAWLAARSPIDVVGEIPVAAVIVLALALAVFTVATTSAARWVAVPLVLVGALLLFQRDLPQLFVSEDARLVGLRTAEGAMAVNLSRPRAFTATDWERAMMAQSVVKPHQAASIDEMKSRFLEAGQPVARSVREAEASGFACMDSLCIARDTSGAIVAHATSMPAALPACGPASLIVITDATAANPCPHTDTVVITARELALHGSASVTFDRNGRPAVRHAIGETLRPWHDHRRFSREARGMPPWQPRARKETASNAQGLGPEKSPTSPEAADDTATSASTP